MLSDAEFLLELLERILSCLEDAQHCREQVLECDHRMAVQQSRMEMLKQKIAFAELAEEIRAGRHVRNVTRGMELIPEEILYD